MKPNIKKYFAIIFLIIRTRIFLTEGNLMEQCWKPLLHFKYISFFNPFKNYGEVYVKYLTR
jgi:hypothetical protein